MTQMVENAKIKRILLVQRSLTHYRRLLVKRLSSLMGVSFDVYVMDGDDSCEEGLRVKSFPSKTRKFTAFGKSYSIVASPKLVNEVVINSSKYDYIILEGATNIVVDLAIHREIKHKKEYIVWDAGRRNNARMTPLRMLVQPFLKRLWRDSAAIIAYSTLARDYFISLGLNPDKVFTCQNTLSVLDFDRELTLVNSQDVDLIKRKFSPNGPLVLYVGAIERRKRLEDLVLAFAKVKKKMPGASLLIIGGGNDLERIKGISDSLDCGGIHFTGPIIDGVITYFKACDLFVLPSEGGLSLNQAMICSKPVIASSADGTELDLIETGKNGYLFSEGDVDELAELMGNALVQPGLLRTMGARSREIIDERANEVLFAKNLTRCLEYVRKGA